MAAFNAALIGYREASRHDDTQKNLLCPPNPYPDTATDWTPATCIAHRALTAWLGDGDLSAWMEQARLNAARGIGAHLSDPRMKSALARVFVRALRRPGRGSGVFREYPFCPNQSRGGEGLR